MNRNVQSRFSWSRACLLADELVHQRRTAPARSGTLRRPARSSIVLELVEPVPQMRRVLVEVDRDLPERIDPSRTLCLPIMVLAVALFAVEIERHYSEKSHSFPQSEQSQDEKKELSNVEGKERPCSSAVRCLDVISISDLLRSAMSSNHMSDRIPRLDAYAATTLIRLYHFH